MSLRRKLIAFLVVVLMVTGSIGLYSFLAAKKELPPEKEAPEVVNYVKVREVAFQNVETEVEAYGRVGSSQPIDLLAEVGGRLIMGDVPLKEGQNFKKGQLLVRVNDVETRLNLQARKSSFLNLIASILPDLKVDYASSFPAWQTYFANIKTDSPLPELPEITDVKEKTFLATKNILSEFYSIRGLEENLRKYRMIAPYNGSISVVNIEPGTYVNPGSNIGRILRTDAFEIKVPIEAKDIQFVELGKRVKVIKGEDESNSLTGRVIRMTDYIDPTTQTFHVYVSVENNQKQALYDGLYLKVVIPGKMVDNAIEVPRGVVRNKGEVFVYNNGQLGSRSVSVIKNNQNTYLITGLKEGDSLVTEAPLNAFEKMKVEIIK
ncbi:MAG: efflux RND transporter periplasmic adaptor subunit [Imperialibacter sp.]|uniref:efflux RND transporter periplasmic adaptor subunit n=1 Tax=Imperialibacter sp. TaxID=2038411 RepID=UPI0032EE5749